MTPVQSWMRVGPCLSRRQSATTARWPTDHARVCLAAPPPASATLPVSSTRASYDGWPWALTWANGRIYSVARFTIGELRFFSFLPLLGDAWGNQARFPATSRGCALPTRARCAYGSLLRASSSTTHGKCNGGRLRYPQRTVGGLPQASRLTSEGLPAVSARLTIVV